MRHMNDTPLSTVATSEEASQNWAGNVATGWNYGEAVGQWNVPCLSPIGVNGYSNAWVGLGGDGYDGGGNLIQAGTESDESVSSGKSTLSYYAWVEDYPNDPTEIYAFSVNCGDTMYADIWQDYTNGNPTKANMYIADWSKGIYWNAWNTSTFSNGSTAEWIVERPWLQYWPNLANFNWVTFSSCYAVQNNNPVMLQDLPHNYSTIRSVTDANRVMASPGPIGVDGNDYGSHFDTRYLTNS
jgi:Peptidase A4 family